MMHFLFKPTHSWAQVVFMTGAALLAWEGHWLAWLIYALVGSVIGSTIEMLVMKSAQPTGDLG